MPNYVTEKQGNRAEGAFKVPIAAIISCSVQTGTTVPASYLICDGAAYLSYNFPLLYSVIAQIYGNGTLNGNGGSSGLFPAWSSATSYSAGQSVSNGGIDYVALTANLNVPPAGNPTVWAVTVGFNVPDYRGQFIRGLDSMGTAAGFAIRDSAGGRVAQNAGGNATYGVQSDMMQGHWHNLYTSTCGFNNPDNGGLPDLYPIVTTDNGAIARDLTNIGYGAPRASFESRPINSAVIYYIKAS